MERTISPDRFTALAFRAFESGSAVYDGHGLTWPVSGSCEAPVTVTLVSQRPSSLSRPMAVRGQNVQVLEEFPDETMLIHRSHRVYDLIETPSPLTMITAPQFMSIVVRCRKCPECILHRRAMWTARALCEFKATPERTWFITLTYHPDARMRLMYEAKKKYGNTDFKSLAAASGIRVTKFLKRIRKNTKAKIRYMVVHEEHRDGFPHVHMLVHEQSRHVSKRELSREWPFGFSVIKLADQSRAVYVCKYINKVSAARVRASHHYGRPKP